MSELRGTLSGPNRFVALSGALAESGVIRLLLGPPDPDARSTLPRGSPMMLEARATDLPALLAQTAPGSVLSTPDGSIRVSLQPTKVDWECAAPVPASPSQVPGRAAEVLASILGPISDSSPPTDNRPGASRP